MMSSGATRAKYRLTNCSAPSASAAGTRERASAARRSTRSTLRSSAARVMLRGEFYLVIPSRGDGEESPSYLRRGSLPFRFASLSVRVGMTVNLQSAVRAALPAAGAVYAADRDE